MKQAGYLYFYDQTAEYSPILHLSVLCASSVFSRLHLCLSERLYTTFSASIRLPKSVTLHRIEDYSLSSPLIKRLDRLYAGNILSSNCPPVERHCVNRWIFLDQNACFGEEELFCIDWDTLVFRSLESYSDLLEKIDLAASNLYTLGWHNPPSEPIWSLCPNMLYIRKPALEEYLLYLEKYISYSECYGSIVSGFFCDMQPWSSVLSAIMVKRSGLAALDFNKHSSALPVVDHNVRILSDCDLEFQEMRYYFSPGTKTFLNTSYLPAKQIVFSKTYDPFFVLREQSLAVIPEHLNSPNLRAAACIHFSGVEGKHLLLQTYLDCIRGYLRETLGTHYPIP